MLFPYTKKIFELDSISTDYFATLLDDLKNISFTGHIIFLEKEISQTVSFLGGNPVSAILWSQPEGVRRLFASDSDIFANLSPQTSLKVLAAEKDAVAMSEVFSRSEPFWRGPHQIATAAGGIQAVCSNLETAILSRTTEGVCELALLTKGKFTVGYRFDKAKNKYIRTGKSFLESNTDPNAILEVYKSGLSSPLPKTGKMDNPLEIIIEKYIMVLEMAGDIIQKQCKNKSQPIEKLLEGLKSKYPPLYKGIYRNPESGQTNWSLMLSNRSKVDVAYRYDKFLLYYDELLMGHIKLLHIHCKKEGLLSFLDKVKQLKEYTPDIAYPPVEQFFRKLDNIANKINSNR